MHANTTMLFLICVMFQAILAFWCITEYII